MTAVLLAGAAASLVMLGVGLVVQVVHYPLFDAYDRDGFPAAHERHSALITRVVLVPMFVQLGTSIALAVDPPDGVAPALAYLAVACAVGTFALTAIVQVPQHARLARGWDAEVHRALVRGNLPRTLLWAVHAAVMLAMLDAVA